MRKYIFVYKYKYIYILYIYILFIFLFCFKGCFFEDFFYLFQGTFIF